MASLKRSLEALQCPFSNNCNINDRSHRITLVRWLEDRKVRELDIEERKLLTDSPKWEENFDIYLDRLGCPLAFLDDTADRVHWLVAKAVALEFEDKGLSSVNNSMSVDGDGGITSKVDTIAGLVGITRIQGESDEGSALA